MTKRDECRGPALGNRCESPAASAEKIYRESPYQALRCLQCSFTDGVLILAGHLPSFFMKQLAQTSVRGLDGVERIENRIEVSG